MEVLLYIYFLSTSQVFLFQKAKPAPDPLVKKRQEGMTVLENKDLSFQIQQYLIGLQGPVSVRN